MLLTHRQQIVDPHRFDQRRRIGGIGLVALDEGAHVAWGQQAHFDTRRRQLATPVMGTAARFHGDQAHGLMGEPAFELSSAQSCTFDHAPALIGDGQLEDVLEKVDSHDRKGGGSIHLGLTLAALR